ncbi:MAG: GntR family transcriptional regulator [Thermoanaerobaculia bacterium]
MTEIRTRDLVISQTDSRPMYLQIVEQIEQRVAVGDWPAGAEIPSIRQLAADLRVSVITVKRAYYELERSGVIATQQGKGSTVAPATRASADLHHGELARQIEHVARLGALSNLSADELAARVRTALAELQRKNREKP